MWKAERVKQLLEEQGRTRKWLAQQCGIEHKTLSRALAEINGYRPGYPVIKLMALALGVPESEIHEPEAVPVKRASGNK